MATDLIYGLLPEHILLALIMLLMLLEIIRADSRLGGLLYLVAVGSGCVVLMAQICSGYSAEPLAQEIRIDHFALMAKLVILGCGLILGICSRATCPGYKFWMLLSSSLMGAMIIMDSAGFISLFIGIEMLSLPAFAMMVHGSGLSSSSEGAFKYLLLSSVASALILFGLSLAYSTTGTLALGDFVGVVQTGGALALTACLLILSGFFLKAALFPFHAWAPDAYSSTRLQVTSFLASVVKGAVVLALVRVLSGLTLNSDCVAIISILSLTSIFYGNLTAISQTGFRRLLAYSSIAHAGYMIFALTDASGGREEALLYYVSVYAVTTIIACASFAMLVEGESDDLAALHGAFASKPLPALLLALAVLSLAGIPPLPGFLAKLFVFKAVIASGHLWPAVLAFAGSYVGVIYYLGIVLQLFAADRQATPDDEQACKGHALNGLVLWSAFALLFILIPGLFQRLLAFL